MKTKISAKIIADSTSNGHRLTTYIVTFPRIVLAELNTHRMFSRNSASSRAIPFIKMLDRVQNDPFIPIKFQKDHSGMQGTEYLHGRDHELAVKSWLRASKAVAEEMTQMNKNIGVTKQLANRPLEAWMWHTAIITASEFENFFALRAHSQAEIHIAKLAEVMLDQYNKSEPKQLKAGEWHIPFGDKISHNKIDSTFNTSTRRADTLTQWEIDKIKIQIATARCARVSYLNFEGKDDYEADVKLHDRLAKMGHWSPFEHCAQAMNNEQYTKLSLWHEEHVEYGVSGNFRGFIQYRKKFNNENLSDDRVINKNK